MTDDTTLTSNSKTVDINKLVIIYSEQTWIIIKRFNGFEEVDIRLENPFLWMERQMRMQISI